MNNKCIPVESLCQEILIQQEERESLSTQLRNQQLYFKMLQLESQNAEDFEMQKARGERKFSGASIIF